MQQEFINFTSLKKLKSAPIVDGLINKLKELKEKAEYLDRKSGLLAQENRALKQELFVSKQHIEEKDAELEDLREQYEILKMAKSLGGEVSEENTELKVRINEYIREIDQCLKLIGD